MAKRGFIIAIQTYAQIQEGLSNELKGTHEQALAFRRCLIDTLGVDAKNIFFCTEVPALEGRTADATRAAIKAEIRRFQQIAKDQTDDLYFYFSGHGFCYTDVDGVPTADVLVASDYVRPEDSGDACLKLDEIQKWLKLCVGVVPPAAAPTAGAHFYFIDACRNLVSEKAIKVFPLGLTYEMSAKRRPPVHTVYSATTGALAKVGSDFPAALIDALTGKGRAKGWYQGTMAVLVDKVRDYIETRLQTSIDSRNDGGTGLLRRIEPAPEYSCTIAVTNADAGDVYQVEVKNEKNQLIDAFEFSGPSHVFKKVPDDYFVRVSLKTPAAGAVAPAEAVPADLYEDCPLTFTKGPRPARTKSWWIFRGEGGRPEAAAHSVPNATLIVIPPAHAEVVVLGGKEPITVAAGMKPELAPGKYVIETRDQRGIPVDRREVTLTAGDNAVDLTVLRDSPLRGSVLGELKEHLHEGAIGFSETLDFTPDQGLDLWLALMGAARIVGSKAEFSKLSPLPLARFDDLAPDASAVYVLAGFEKPTTTFRAVMSTDWRSTPQPIAGHERFTGLFEVTTRLDGAAYRYLTVQVDENAPITLGVSALPNRVTLVTLSHDSRGNLVCQQFVLPVKHLMATLPQQGGLGMLGFDEKDLHEIAAPLRVVRRCVDVQRTFARGSELSQVLTPRELEFLLYFKWFEPIVALMAAYELVRRGKTESLPTVVNNLRFFFQGLPDTEALASMAGIAPATPVAPPLILEGFQALDLMPGRKDLPPAEALIFRGPWTTWRSVSRSEDR